jgi:hypothetical protein
LAQQVFFAIGNIAFVCDFERILLESNSVAIAIECLTQHDEWFHMCTDAVFFLKNMAYGGILIVLRKTKGSELGREEILARGGIKATLNALWKNQVHAELAELAMNLFFDLSFSGMATNYLRSLSFFKAR